MHSLHVQVSLVSGLQPWIGNYSSSRSMRIFPRLHSPAWTIFSASSRSVFWPWHRCHSSPPSSLLAEQREQIHPLDRAQRLPRVTTRTSAPPQAPLAPRAALESSKPQRPSPLTG